MEYFYNLLLNYGLNEEVAWDLAIVMMIVFIILGSAVLNGISNVFIDRILHPFVMKNAFKWDDLLLKRRVFHRLFYLLPAIIVGTAIDFFHPYEGIVQKAAAIYGLVIGIFVINAFLNSLNDIYTTFPISKSRPIKGLLQVVKIVLFILIGVVIIAVLLGKSPLILLSGFGALTAVLTLVFKDSILGFVAGIQLAANDMLRIGDWIEMTKYGANGEIIEISLNTVKVKNFDNTIVTIPAYALVSDSFKNWRGMQISGARRILRAINIDMTSISVCSEEMIEKFKKIPYLANYIQAREKEMAQYTEEHNGDESVKAYGSRLTNIGLFRVYLENYLKHHPQIRGDMTIMVRQLPPAEYGLPIEVYAFVNDVNSVYYENAQADIFEHILAVIGEFGLRVYQAPAGYDIKHALSIKNET